MTESFFLMCEQAAPIWRDGRVAASKEWEEHIERICVARRHLTQKADRTIEIIHVAVPHKKFAAHK
jgi:hypothetical protein